MNFPFLQNVSFRQRMFSLPVMILLGAACVSAAYSWQMGHQKMYAAGINLAGRQRMLNQRHAREVLEQSLGRATHYLETRELLFCSLRHLKDGGDHEFGKVPPSRDPILVERLAAQQMALQHAFDVADRYLEKVAWKQSQGKQSLNSIEDLRDKFILATNEAHQETHGTVQELARISIENSRTSSQWFYGLGAMVVFVCSFWALFVCESASKIFKRMALVFFNLSKSKLQRISRDLRQDAADTADQANMASGAAEQVSLNALSLSNAVYQFEESIKEIAGNASGAATVARSAVEATNRTNQTISRLGESSSEIGNVIKVINSIAEQTNLLALNATIEAARAGDAGKGFAVVANEVKELAKETSKATEDIIQRIEAIQTDTVEAVDAIETVSQIISEINESQDAIAGAVEEQSVMTSEISRNISEVAIGSGEIAKNVSTVADTAKSTTAGSEQTLMTADTIEELVEELLVFVGDRKTKAEVGNVDSQPQATQDRAKTCKKGKYQIA